MRLTPLIISTTALLLAPALALADCNPSPLTCPAGQIQYYVPSNAECPQGNFTCSPSVTYQPARTSPSPTHAPATAASSVVRTLSYGTRGSDVLSLQKKLVSLGYLASGNDTGFFGRLTEAAVRKLQAAVGIVSSGTPSTTGYGAVGARTRAALASNTIPPAPSASAAEGSRSFGGSTASAQSQTQSASSLLDSLYSQLRALQARLASLMGAASETNSSVPTTSSSSSSSSTTTTSSTGTTASDAACSWGGASLASGSSVSAYKESSVAYGGSCTSQTRTCSNGTLAGSFGYASCSVQGAASCAWNNQSLQNGVSVTAYQSSSVSYGSTCTSQTRSCSNGTLSGSYAYASCSVQSAASCTLNGATVANGSSKTFYSRSGVDYGSSCSSYAQTRTCSNGTLSGSYTNSSCVVGSASSCTWNNSSVSNGASVTAYQASSVAYGSTCTSQTRTCSNGTLSGSYAYSSCSVSSAASCTFNGSTVANGASVTAYQSSSVAYGGSCTSQTRSCSNGTLSGSYTNASCSVASASSCSFNGSTVANGASVTAYQSSSVSYGSSCTSQTRSCSNGTLSGSYAYSSCSVASASSCSFNGSTVANGASVTAYQSSSVSYGSSCTSQTRSCSNGTLSGSYAYSSCSVASASSCSFNGSTVASGSSVTAYKESSVASGSSCASETRSCSNGALSGSYQYASCSASAQTIPSDITSFIQSQYSCLLGRSADQSDITSRTARIQSGGSSIESEYRSFLLSEEFLAKRLSDSAYVRTLFRCLLFREDTAHDDVLSSAAYTRYLYFSMIENSDEFTNNILPKLKQATGMQLRNSADTAPIGTYSGDTYGASSFSSGGKTLMTHLFYWYNAPKDGTYGPKADGLTHHPPSLTNPPFSYASSAWWKKELSDISAAGIDVALPVYWGFPDPLWSRDNPVWSYGGLMKGVEVLREMDAAGQAHPKIGMFYDTSTMASNVLGHRLDLRNSADLDFAYRTIRDFYSIVPARYRAMLDGKPIVVLYANQSAGHDSSSFDYIRSRFRSDFGTDLYIIADFDWGSGGVDALTGWGAATLGIYSSWPVVEIGAGMDNSAVYNNYGGASTGGEDLRIIDRRGGGFYEMNWLRAIGTSPRIAILETWNELYEGTDIMETAEFGRAYIDITKRFSGYWKAGFSGSGALRAYLYQCVLGRDYDSGADVTGTLSGLYHHFFDSSEYQNKYKAARDFIADVYRCALFRNADSSEIDVWYAKLANNQLDRPGVLDDILGSEEFVNGPGAVLKSATGLSLASDQRTTMLASALRALEEALRAIQKFFGY